ncbi:uncharacterized protein LOC142497880 [Ascaphus truei]|uniref:uncharacterized protein LOC142497880 n=1 Tax=Ascaphus truei TaxID=8439 RepID=UPI003F5A228F
MRSLLQVLCVLSALVATGYSLSCTECVGSTDTSCTGPSITCPADHVCVSSYTVLTAGGIETKIFTRTCESKSKCGINGSITLPTYKSQMGSSCCTTDDCTPSMPTLPANNNIKNGVTCRTCISANSDYCYTSDTIECTGDEKMCLLQSTKISGSISSTVAIRGCATESICNVGRQSLSNGDKNMEVKTNCIKGGYSLTCIGCIDMADTSCTGSSISCPADNVCLSSYTVTTVGGIEISTLFTRSCELQSKCDMSGSIIIPNGKIKTTTSCCTTDNCTPPIPTLPANNYVKNGLTCPSCVSANSDWCYPSDTIQCTGDEKKCLIQSTKISGSISSTVAFRGCATESICNIGSQYVSDGGTNIEVKTSCTNQGHSLSCAVCVNMSGTSCTGPSITCPADNVCMSSYTVTTVGGIETNNIFSRGCELQSKCVISGSISIPNGKVKMSSSCCTSDNCTPPIPTLPADNSVMNGLTCRACASADTDECYTSDTMECTGSEKMCLLQTTKKTGYSLSCRECVGMAGTSCTGSSITCPAGNVCISSYTVTNIGGIEAINLARGCESQSQCGMSGSISTALSTIKTSTSCCTTDNCTPPIPTLPADNNVKNGLTCRTCVSADSNWCYTPDTMQCTGDEKMCFLQSTKISGSSSLTTAVRGCATQSICNMGSQSSSSGGTTVDVKTSCTNGRSSSLTTAVRGCATQSICNMGSQSSSSGGTTVDVKTSCTNGRSSSSLTTAVRGCATQSICNISSQSSSSGGTTVDVKTSCTNGSNGLYPGYFFPAVVALMLIKLLF